MKKLIIALLLIPSFVFAQEDIQIEPIKVADNIYMLKGRGGNMAISIGVDGILLIDSQFETMVQKTKDALKSLSDKEVRFLVNTHYHGDHTGGNRLFGEDGKIIVAHKNVHHRLSTDQYSKFRNSTTKAVPRAAQPIISFDHFINFHINDDFVQVMNFNEGAHTDGDAIVYFQKENVVHTGDLYVTYGFPFIDSDAGGSLKGLIKSLDKVLLIIDEDTKVIPGHGDMGTKDDVQKFRDRLVDIVDILDEAVAQNKDLNAVINANPLAPYEDEWGNGFIKSKDFITLTYPEFKINESKK